MVEEYVDMEYISPFGCIKNTSKMQQFSWEHWLNTSSSLTTRKEYVDPSTSQ